LNLRQKILTEKFKKLISLFLLICFLKFLSVTF
jgi:hypothetical protein